MGFWHNLEDTEPDTADLESFYPQPLGDWATIKMTATRGKGLFAAKDIPQGQLIFYEQPLMEISSSEPEFGMWAAPILAAKVKNFSLGEKWDYEQLVSHADSELPDENVRKVLANAFMSPIKEESGNTWRVCPGIANANHACVPNAFFQWQQIEINASYQWRATLRALESINRGQEILIDYLSEDLRFLSPTVGRILETREWNFRCQCSKCTLHRAGRKATDARRRTIRLLATKLQVAVELDLAYPNFEDDGLRCVALCKAEGIRDPRLAHLYLLLSEFAELKGNFALAAYYCKQGADVEAICHGKTLVPWGVTNARYQQLLGKAKTCLRVQVKQRKSTSTTPGKPSRKKARRCSRKLFLRVRNIPYSPTKLCQLDGFVKVEKEDCPVMLFDCAFARVITTRSVT